MDILKQPHGAGGFTITLTSGKGNTKIDENKKVAIIKALQDSWTEGVYVTSNGKIIRQLLNGGAQTITKDKENGSYYFS